MWPWEPAFEPPTTLPLSSGPPARNISGTCLGHQTNTIKLLELETRIIRLEQAFIDLCDGLRVNLDRIDRNTQLLDKNTQNLASMTLKPPKDLLGGTGSERN